MTDHLPTVGTTDGLPHYYLGPVWKAFGLTRTAYLVVPRRTLQSMPLDWQERFIALMDEAQEQLPADAFPEYSVQRKESGRVVVDPLRDYRHTSPIARNPPVTLTTIKPPRHPQVKVRPVAEIPEES